MSVNDAFPESVNNAAMRKTDSNLRHAWVAHRLEELGRKRRELADALSLTPSRVTEILKGTRQVSALESRLMAKFLKMPEPQVLFLLDNPAGSWVGETRGPQWIFEEEKRKLSLGDDGRHDSGTINHPAIRSNSPSWDREPSEQEAALPASNVSPAEMPKRLDPYRAKRVPLLGMAQGGGDGSFILNTGEPIMFVERPIGLAGRDRVYALRVEGNSMYPIHEDGDLIFVDPGRKAYPGRDAVIELYSEQEYENQTRALLKRIVAVNGEFIIVKEMQPKEREFRIPRAKIKALHLVLKNSEMY